MDIINTDDELVKYAKAGENVTLKLVGIEDEAEAQIKWGSVICTRE